MNSDILNIMVTLSTATKCQQVGSSHRAGMYKHRKYNGLENIRWEGSTGATGASE